MILGRRYAKLVLCCKGAMIPGGLRTTDFVTAFCVMWFISTNTMGYSHAVMYAFSHHWPSQFPCYMLCQDLSAEHKSEMSVAHGDLCLIFTSGMWACLSLSTYVFSC
jgi:hypothetical protein